MAACGALTGCVAGTVTSPVPSTSRGDIATEEPTSDDGDPEAYFTARVLPLLDLRCRSCHETGTGGAARFMEGEDVYTTVRAFPNLVEPGEPRQSALVTHGQHLGPPWAEPELPIVEHWIELEGSAGDEPSNPGVDERDITSPTGADVPSPLPISTDGFTVGDEHVSLALDDLGLAGSTAELDVAWSAGGVRLSNITFVAGPDGVRISHPRFVASQAGQRIAFDGDRFETVVVEVAPGLSLALATSVTIADFPSDALLVLEAQFATTAD